MVGCLRVASHMAEVRTCTRKGVGVQLPPRAPTQQAPASHLNEREPAALPVDLRVDSGGDMRPERSREPTKTTA